MKPFQLGQKEWKKGVVVERLDERSYEIDKGDGSTYRRNRFYLRKTNVPPLGKLSVNKYRPQPTKEMREQLMSRPRDRPSLNCHKYRATLMSLTHTHPVKGHLLGIHCVLNHAKRHRSPPLKSEHDPED